MPWRRERLPTPGFQPGEFHGLENSCIVHGVANMKSVGHDWLSLFVFTLIHIFITFNFFLFPLKQNRKCQDSIVGSGDRKHPEGQKLEGWLPYSLLQGLVVPDVDNLDLKIPLIYQQSSENSQELYRPKILPKYFAPKIAKNNFLFWELARNS